MMYARATKKAKRAEGRALEAKATAEQATQALDLAVQTLPGVAKLVFRPQQSSTIGKVPVAKLAPAQLQVLVRAMHMPSNSRVRCGVTHKRLICSGAMFYLDRQGLGLERIEAMSSRCADAGNHGPKIVHMQYNHCWDEVNCKFRRIQDRRLRLARSATAQQIIVQRGVLAVTLLDMTLERAMQFTEVWVCQPRQVRSTDAASLMPALNHALPPSFNIFPAGDMSKVSRSASTITVGLFGDKAASNLLLMKAGGKEWEENIHPRMKNIFILADSCGVHLHHRMKLQLRPLQQHTSRHFSLAALFRQGSIQAAVNRKLEQIVHKQVQRVLEPPPPPEGSKASLPVLLDILFDCDADYHCRGDGSAKSAWAQDLEALARMCNADLLDERGWRHCCLTGDGRKPCCPSQASAVEKTYIAVNNVLMRIEQTPCESRWTNTLANFRKTILGHILYRCGLNSFCPLAHGTVEEQFAVDAEACEGAFEAIRKARIRRTSEYLRDDNAMAELVVLTCILIVLDSNLLYPMMGDMEPKVDDEVGKLPRFLTRSESLVGKAGQELFNLMRGWSRGGSTRRPWALLDAVEAPVREQQFMRWSRGQIIRACASFGRRYEVRYSSFPYLLYRICSTEYSQDEKQRVADKIMLMPRSGLDIYTFGLREFFGDAEGLLSWQCQQQIRSDLRAHPYGTDEIERLNSELSKLHPPRSPARGFITAARESVLRQIAAGHCGRGGVHPLSPQSVSTKQREKAQVIANPLLSDPSLADGAHDDGRRTPRAQTSQEPLAFPIGDGSAGARSTDVPPSAVGDLVPAGPFFGEPVRSVRDFGALVLRAGDKVTEESLPSTAKIGLSPYMLACNRHLHTVKTLAGRNLRTCEVVAARSEFRKKWDSMPDKSAFEEDFKEWRLEDDTRRNLGQKIVSYRLGWGGGCPATPATVDEYCNFLQSSGW